MLSEYESKVGNMCWPHCTMFRGNRPTVSGEEDFFLVFTIYGHGGHLGHVTRVPRINFRSPYPKRLHIKFGFDWPSGVGEEDL